MNWIDDIIANYYKWLKDKTSYKEDTSTGWYKITTPFLGLFNDPIEIYLKKDDDKIKLSDDGVTIESLELCGVDIARSPKRKEWVEFIKRNYGIDIAGKELVTIASLDNFAQKKHNLVCAIEELCSLEMTAKHTISAMFREDVKNLLIEQDMIFTPQFIAKGSTGIEFTFDFQIAGRKNETVIKTFNTLNKLNVPNFLFSWEDIKANREQISGKELKGLAIVNDADNAIKHEYLTALESKGADFILWSERYNPANLLKLKAA